LPNEWDDISAWQDLQQWRAVMFDTLADVFKADTERSTRLASMPFPVIADFDFTIFILYYYHL